MVETELNLKWRTGSPTAFQDSCDSHCPLETHPLCLKEIVFFYVCS